MKTLELSKATAALSQYAREAVEEEEPLVLTARGKAVAAVVPIGEDLETFSLSMNPEFIAILEESRRRCPPGQGISSNEMRRRLGLPGRRRGSTA